MHDEVRIPLVRAAFDDAIPGRRGREVELEPGSARSRPQLPARDRVELEPGRGARQPRRRQPRGDRPSLLVGERPRADRDDVDVAPRRVEVAEDERAVQVDADERFAEGRPEPFEERREVVRDHITEW